MRLRDNTLHYSFCFVVVVIHLLLGAYAFWHWWNKTHFIYIAIAHFFGFPLHLAAALIVLPVADRFLTKLRSVEMHQVLPLNKSRSVHKFLVVLIFVYSALHGLFHWTAHIVKGEPLKTIHSTRGITGHLMILVLCIIAVGAFCREKHFNYFRCTHKLYFVWYALLFIHMPNTIYWFGVPLLLYITELIINTICAHKVKVLAVKKYATSIELFLQKPNNFPYIPGQYIFLNIPRISVLEQHPFSVVSAPEDYFLRLLITQAGDWTERVFNAENLEGEVVKIAGPFGSPTQHIHDPRQQVSVMIGVTVGATPHISILRQYRKYQALSKHISLNRKIYFLWVVRSVSTEWCDDFFNITEAEGITWRNEELREIPNKPRTDTTTNKDRTLTIVIHGNDEKSTDPTMINYTLCVYNKEPNERTPLSNGRIQNYNGRQAVDMEEHLQRIIDENPNTQIEVYYSGKPSDEKNIEIAVKKFPNFNYHTENDK